MGEEETLKNIGNVVAGVRWKDCEPWETVRVPVKLIRPNVSAILYEYWK